MKILIKKKLLLLLFEKFLCVLCCCNILRLNNDDDDENPIGQNELEDNIQLYTKILLKFEEKRDNEVSVSMLLVMAVSERLLLSNCFFYFILNK